MPLKPSRLRLLSLDSSSPLRRVVERTRDRLIAESPVAKTAASAGLVLIVIAEFLSPGGLQAALADVGFVGLVVAAVCLFVGRSSTAIPEEKQSTSYTRSWRWTITGLGVAGALLTQTWFQSGTAIAGGDISPPVGTAWISRIFSTFTWSGADLGSPAHNEGQLPWSSVSWVIHALGGSGALAQRIWFSLAIAAILMAAGALARSLQFAPLAGAVVALLYFYNPMTLSQIDDNAVYLVAMALVPALAAVVVSYGTNRIRLWQVGLSFIIAAPFVGYIYANPPLVGMLALTTALAPLLGSIRFGREVGRRSLHGALVGGLLVAGASAYWIIPSRTALSGIASGQLSAISAWAFTESRSTLTNGLWLNTSWGWAFPQYFPYAQDFSRFPFDIIPACVPLIALSVLTLRNSLHAVTTRLTRLAGALALGALGVVFLSTGTRSPGNILFDPLYRLPYGWLLREPGRFLIISALGYALLAGILTMRGEKSLILHGTRDAKTAQPRSFRIPSSFLIALIAVAVALASSFPLWIGTVIPGPRDGFPSAHVTIPHYWISTADYLNSSSSPRGPLLVLPADDFYQMPYTWYYGNDGFITDLLQRHVVVPSGGGYNTVSGELLKAVKLEDTSLLQDEWKEAGRLLVAAGTKIILVRGDIKSKFPNRTITSPSALASRLSVDPEMRLIFNNGPLSLYELRSAYDQRATMYATSRSSSPNLKDLALLPRRTALVSSKPEPGHVALFRVPPISKWNQTASTLSTNVAIPKGRRYTLASLKPGGATGATVAIKKSSMPNQLTATIRLSGTTTQPAGNFAANSWGTVGNCDAATPVVSPNFIRAKTIAHGAPGGGPSLQLLATIDSACISKSVAWHGGSLLLSLQERTYLGANARLCVWEEPIDRCANIASLPVSQAWQRFTSAIRPDPGTKSLTLFLYADGSGTDLTSVEGYADIKIEKLASDPHLVLVGTPTNSPVVNQTLRAFPTGYSKQWTASPLTHVRVDGLRNGWLLPPAATTSFTPNDTATARELPEELLLALAAFVAAGALVWRRRSSPRR